MAMQKLHGFTCKPSEENTEHGRLALRFSFPVKEKGRRRKIRIKNCQTLEDKSLLFRLCPFSSLFPVALPEVWPSLGVALLVPLLYLLD